MKAFLALWVCLFSVSGFAELQKYPNADSLSYWNRAVEMQDALLVLKKQLVEAEGLLVSQNFFLQKKKELYAKHAASEFELRESQWLADDLVFKIAEIKEEIADAELFEKLFQLRYRLAKEEKQEVVSQIASLYTQQWKKRGDLNDVRLARAKNELAFRQWQFESAQLLYKKKAESEDNVIRARDRRDDVLSRIQTATQRAELARKAEKDSLDTERAIER